MRAVIAVLVLLAGACAAPARVEAQPSTAALEARLQAAIAELAASDPTIPAVVATVRAPRRGLDWTGGVANAQERDAGGTLTARPFRLASVTKVVTASAIFRLIEMGRVDVDAPIARYISPETQATLTGDGYDTQAITVAHLLGHSSGIADHAQTDAYFEALRADPRHRWTRQEQIAFSARHADPLFTPGTRFRYSDTGYIILGEIIERVSGEAYAPAIRRLVKFDRLGLRSTWYESLEPAPTREPQMRQFFRDVEFTANDPSFDLWGGGGLQSTTQDMATLFRAIFHGEIFEEPETLPMALTIQPIQELATGDAHSLLMFRQRVGRRTCYGHGGFWGTYVAYCPANDVVIALTVNQTVPARPRAMYELLDRLGRIVDEG